LGSLLLALLFLMAIMLKLGYILGANKVPAVLPITSTSMPAPSSLTVLRSSYGFGFTYDSNSLQALATADKQNVETSDLREGKNITTVSMKPRGEGSRGIERAVQLKLQLNPDADAFNRLKQLPKNTNMSDGEIAQQMFSITQSSDVVATVSSTSADVLDGVAMQKTVYMLSARFGATTTPTYAVSWSGLLNGKAFSLQLLGLVGSYETPTIFRPVFDSLNLQASQKVAAAISTQFASIGATPKLNNKYISDLFSPAVVKIYHVVCGKLVIGGQVVTGDNCSGSTGSGFLASADGYIATNGHVISYTAKDLFVEIILSNPALLNQFLQAAGLSASQIAQLDERPELLAAVIAKIYDVPDSELRFDNKREITLVALGTQPIRINNQEDVKKLVEFVETNEIKKAELIGMDYAAKDIYTIESGSKSGFSSSDVALLKINIKNAPFIPLLTVRDNITQNQPILVMGFPGDAENALIDNTTLAVTVTNGNVSSIRDAAGGSNKLFQSDADASHGNSGGPALTEDGHVFGLLTYRFQSGSAENAAKSYIRDINDLVKLAEANNIHFATISTTQNNWDKGIELFSAHHFSAAKKEFLKVKADYPMHRLADSYIAAADQAIEAGEDITGPPAAVLISGAVLAALAIVITVILIARHRGYHQLFRLNQHYGMLPETGEPYPINHHPPKHLPHPALGINQPTRPHHNR
jgi:S1-C subfamily serine protease